VRSQAKPLPGEIIVEPAAFSQATSIIEFQRQLAKIDHIPQLKFWGF
jgi:hypothetical protein